MNQQTQSTPTMPASGPTPDAILQLGFGFWGSKTLLSAVELGVFTTLAEGPMSGEALTEKLKLHPRSARDFFDALVGLGQEPTQIIRKLASAARAGAPHAGAVGAE